MLKQVMIFLISSAIIIFSGFWEIKYLENSSRYILSDIQYSKNALNNNNFELAKAHVEKLEDTWDSMKNVWSMFVFQEDIEEIESRITMYKIHTKYNDREEAIIDCDLLRGMIQGIIEKHKVICNNIF